MDNKIIDIQPVATQIAAFNERELALELVEFFALQAESFNELESVARSYMTLGDPKSAMKYGDRALDRMKDEDQKTIMLRNMIGVYRAAGYPDRAMSVIEHFETYVNTDELKIEKAEILYELNHKSKAQEILDEIKKSSLQNNLLTRYEALSGNLLLWNGEFKKGLQKVIFDGNKAREINAPVKEVFHTRKELPFPFWEGTPDCKNLVIYAEAGVGDEILNIRFMEHLKEKGINAVWFGVWHSNPEVNKRAGVFDLFTNSGFRVITSLDQLDSNLPWMWTYSQYLPISLGLTDKDLWRGPYLKSNKRLMYGKKKRIGIRWYGNDTPLHRNYPLKELYKVLKDVDADKYSLQRDTGMDELKDFPGIIDLQKDMTSFSDTAELINSMDLVITSCTSIAHASAALGKKTMIFVPICAYYPWCHSGDKSPWYGENITLLRQKTPRSWSEPMAELASLLAKEKI